jgi:hypothetical protein
LNEPKEERDATAQDDRRSARVAWKGAVAASLLLLDGRRSESSRAAVFSITARKVSDE